MGAIYGRKSYTFIFTHGKLFLFFPYVLTPWDKNEMRSPFEDQTLRHFSDQILIFIPPLFTKYFADLTKISDSSFVCGVDLKCCYSSLVRIGLIRLVPKGPNLWEKEAHFWLTGEKSDILSDRYQQHPRPVCTIYSSPVTYSEVRATNSYS